MRSTLETLDRIRRDEIAQLSKRVEALKQENEDLRRDIENLKSEIRFLEVRANPN